MNRPTLLIRVCPDWPALRQAQSVPGALFLDRDGVLNVDSGYISDAGTLTLIEGAAEVVRNANQKGVRVVIVSNQSGVGRGYYDWASVVAVDDRLVELLTERNAYYDLALYAGAAPGNQDGSSYRKPGDGMIKAAAQLLPVDLSTSWIVGDKLTDLEAGRMAGLLGGVLVGSRSEGRQPDNDASFTMICARDLSEAWETIRHRFN